MIEGVSVGPLALIDSRPTAAERELLAAAASGDRRRLRRLLESGCSPNARDERGRTGLILAAQNRHLKTMHVLLEAGAEINGRDTGKRRWPALMHALDADHSAAALALLEWGADPDAGEESGYNALMMASSRGDHGVVEELLARGADPEAELFLGFTALDYAIGYGHVAAVRLLLAAAPQLRDRGNPARRSVMALASCAGEDEILEMVSGAA